LATSPRFTIRDAVADFADAVCTIGSTADAIDTVDKISRSVELLDSVGIFSAGNFIDSVDKMRSGG
jgi:hypothetical protein